MKLNIRREPRSPSRQNYNISWQDEEGLTHAAQVQAHNSSESGIGFRYDSEIPEGTVVYIQAENGYSTGYTVVRHLTALDSGFEIGVEFDETVRDSQPARDSDDGLDYYEFLQISPKAQAETIQRVYRFLAARYHPDNPETGDLEKFLTLNRAYDVLSSPESRTQYDNSLKVKPDHPDAVFETVDFMDGVEGEVNRRLAVLSLLYRKCRANVNNPHVSLLDLEAYMGFPREYLDFTIWYLRNKKFVKQEDNGEMALTAAGVDYIEENYTKLPLLRKLLEGGGSFTDNLRNATGMRENGNHIRALEPGRIVQETITK